MSEGGRTQKWVNQHLLHLLLNQALKNVQTTTLHTYFVSSWDPQQQLLVDVLLEQTHRKRGESWSRVRVIGSISEQVETKERV